MSNGDNSLEDALRLATIGAGMSIRSDFDTRTRYSDVADTECLDEWQEGGDIQAIAADIDAVKTAATRVALEALPRRGHGDGPAYNLIHVTALKSNFKSGVPVDARKDPLHARSSDLMPGRIIGEHLAVHVNEGVAHFGVPLSFRLISEGLAVAVVDYDTSNALATRILDAQDAGMHQRQRSVQDSHLKQPQEYGNTGYPTWAAVQCNSRRHVGTGIEVGRPRDVGRARLRAQDARFRQVEMWRQEQIKAVAHADTEHATVQPCN